MRQFCHAPRHAATPAHTIAVTRVKRPCGHAATVRRRPARQHTQAAAVTATSAASRSTRSVEGNNAPASKRFGGALYMRDGNLNVIDSVFRGNHAAPLGPDTGGGAIYVVGSKHGVVIADSTFEHNGASNAAAVGGLFAELNI